MPELSKILEPLGASIDADLPVSDAIRELASSGRDALLISKDGTPVGVFTAREALKAFADGSGPVERYMRRPLPGRSLADSLEAGADIMVRGDNPYVLLTQDEGPLFKKTARPVGIANAFAVLQEIGKTTTDTSANKVFLGHRDL